MKSSDIAKQILLELQRYALVEQEKVFAQELLLLKTYTNFENICKPIFHCVNLTL